MSKRKVDPDKVSGALAQRTDENGRRHIKLTIRERQALRRQEQATAAAFFFLDLQQSRTWKEIADEMGLSPHQLRDLTKTEEFDTAYNDLFVELGKDPRYKAAQAALADMVPLAVHELKSLLTSPRTPAGTRLKAIEKIISLNGIENIAPQQSNRQELVTFLIKNDINIESVGITLPEMYQDVIDDVIDAEEAVIVANENPQLAMGTEE